MSNNQEKDIYKDNYKSEEAKQLSISLGQSIAQGTTDNLDFSQNQATDDNRMSLIEGSQSVKSSIVGGVPINYSETSKSTFAVSSIENTPQKLAGSIIGNTNSGKTKVEDVIEEEDSQEETLVEKSYEQAKKELLEEQKKNFKIFGDKKSGFAKSNCCGRCLFTWINPLISFTRKNKKLTLDNFGVLKESEKVEYQLSKLRKDWEKKSKGKQVSKHALFKSVIWSFKSEYMYTMIMTIIVSCLQMSSPFIIKPLIQYVKDGENMWKDIIQFPDFTDNQYLNWLKPDMQYGISLALLFVLSQGFAYLLQENIAYRSNMIGAWSTNALIGLIYEKQFKLTPATNKVFTNGEIITFVQVDANKLYFLSSNLPSVCTLPFTIILCFTILFYYLGLTFFSGIVVFIVSMLFNVALSKCLAQLQQVYMKRSGSRVSTTTESINNIKIIKLYSWIEIFKDLINKKRKDELSVQFKRMCLLCVTLASMTFWPMVLRATTFGFYIGLGNSIDFATAYTVITVFTLMQTPLRWLPFFIGQFIEFAVAMGRIQKFLVCDEINPAIVDQQMKSDINSIEIRDNANFHWGITQDEKKDDKAKKKDHKAILDARKSKGKKPTKEEEQKQKLLGDDLNEQSPSKNSEKFSSAQSQKENQTVEDFVSLKGLDLQIKKGEFVCIIGDVGSGKSSLLSSMIGDMLYLNKDFLQQNGEEKINTEEVKLAIRDESTSKRYQQSPIIVSQDLSYVQQVPWIQNKTIKDNITFGEPFDQAWYKETIKICELTRDLQILPAGDQTEIGEKGINLSGGQKSRVSLARAVYANRGLILMDDPISALDANVKKKIFQNVFIGALKDKTRVLVTHAVDFLHLVDQVIVLKEGQIALKGNYNEIKEDPYLLQLMKIYKSHQTEQQELVQKSADQGVKKDSVEMIEVNQQDPEDENDVRYPKDFSNSCDVTIERSLFEDHDDQPKKKNISKKLIKLSDLSKENDQKKKGKMMTDENDEKISVGLNVQWKFFSKYYGLSFFVLTQLAFAVFLLSNVASDYLVGQWTYQDDQQNKFWYYCLMSFALASTAGIGVLFRSLASQLFTYRASKRVHQGMIDRILYAPVNLYFDVTPSGRILNKFSKDLNSFETQLGWQVGLSMQNAYLLLQVLVTAMIAVYWIGLLIPLILVISYFIIRSAHVSVKETVRLFNTTKSPLLSYLGESISGSSTIRAFGKTDEFIQGNNKLLNENILATQMMAGVSGWFSIRVDLLAIFLMLVISLTCVIARSFNDSENYHILFSMVLSQCLSIQANMVWCLKVVMQMQSTMVNVERCLNMLDVPQERQLEPGQPDLLKNRDQWPEEGVMEFRGVSLKYRPDTETVLHQLTFKVAKGEKIGVVGRTGAGKSTICLSISRIVEIFEGQIVIDGIDIQKISLHELRKRITVIPQDPTMFDGTLRFNLDPEGRATDDEITSLLEKAQLESVLYSNMDGLQQVISENGANLSSGERQLICICRAILRKSKVVVLDEATANIDMVTEQKIQDLITSQFTDSTVLTIAHRINTIIQSDRVLVLSFGRIKEFDSPTNLMQNPESEFSELLKELKKEQK